MQGVPIHSCKIVPRLFRQADPLAKGLHSRITTKQGELRGVEGSADAHGTELSHAVESLQGAVFITQPGKDYRL